MSGLSVRAMTSADRSEVADLICVSLNTWYQLHGGPKIMPGGPAHADVFYEVYEALDPGCGIVAVCEETGRLMGSCFYHPRPLHISLGIMNTHPNYAGRGAAAALARYITDLADAEDKPVRLVSSAMNLDSFSLYNRAGFVPRLVYQDMIVRVPESGMPDRPEAAARVRAAAADDVAAINALEMELVGIDREKDFFHFLANRERFWHLSVIEEGGKVAGFMASCGHAGCNMIGPGLCRTADQAVALVWCELDRYRGRTPVFLAPAENTELVRRMYAMGAKNCELHFHQIRGHYHPFQGVNMPTFLPESG